MRAARVVSYTDQQVTSCTDHHTASYTDQPIASLRKVLSEESSSGRVLLRIESPGRHLDTEECLLALGNQLGEERTAADNKRLVPPFEKGLIREPRLWYRGWCSMLDAIAAEIAGLNNIICMNSISDIKVMFDKELCNQRLSAIGVRVPKGLGVIKSYDHLLARMRDLNISRVFLKVANGSSGSGVVAYRHNDSRCEAITTVEISGQDLYNSRRIRSYSDTASIRRLIGKLGEHHLWAEEWLPKASLQNKTFDLRVLVIDGKAHHVVVRSGKYPITNLHLLNERSDVSALRDKMRKRAWNAMLESCERTMLQAFPNSFYGGIDVAISPSFAEHAILEVNAFGDQLNDCTYDGNDTYTAELLALLSTTRKPWSPAFLSSSEQVTKDQPSFNRPFDQDEELDQDEEPIDGGRQHAFSS